MKLGKIHMQVYCNRTNKVVWKWVRPTKPLGQNTRNPRTYVTLNRGRSII